MTAPLTQREVQAFLALALLCWALMLLGRWLEVTYGW